MPSVGMIKLLSVPITSDVGFHLSIISQAIEGANGRNGTGLHRDMMKSKNQTSFGFSSDRPRRRFLC